MSLALLHSASAGELLAAEIRISPRLLEDLLEVLASAPFPINPELEHASATLHSVTLHSATLHAATLHAATLHAATPNAATSKIHFPLYDSQLNTLRDILVSSGFAASLLEVHSMAAEVSHD